MELTNDSSFAREEGAAAGAPGRRRQERRRRRQRERRREEAVAGQCEGAAARQREGAAAWPWSVGGSGGAGVVLERRWRRPDSVASSSLAASDENARGVERFDSTPTRRVFGCFLDPNLAKTGPPNDPRVF
jgi:hypothetical protein